MADRAGALAIDLVSTAQGIAALRDDWTRLLCASGANSVFLTWEWVSTWWQIYGSGSHLYVLTARTPDGTIVGLAPLKRTGTTVSFIGTGSDVTPEHLDVIVRAGWEASVIGRFVERLLRDPEVHELDLQAIDSAETLSHLSRTLGAASGILQRRRGPSCPYLVLPRSVEEFDRTRSRNYRKKIGEFERRCARVLQTRLRRSTTTTDVIQDMSRLCDLHRRRWGATSRAFRSQEYIDFHNAFALLALERGWLRLYSLDSADQTVAMLYCHFYGGRYYYYQSGRDPEFARERVGLVLMHQVVREAIHDGADVFDFLSGDEPYKYRWATDRSRAMRIVYWRSFTASARSLWRRRMNAVLDVQGRLAGNRAS